jgi:hypothetical protein
MSPTLSQMATRLATATAFVLLVPLGGCSGNKTAEVSGRVRVNGKAPEIPGLMITFMSANGEVVASEVGPDGTYRAKDVPVGEMRVGFSLAGAGQATKRTNAPDKTDPKTRARENVSQLKAGSREKSSKLPLPAKFLDPLKSGLVFTVEPGSENTYSPDLK